MRILAVTPSYEPEGGGLERYAHRILARLAARGHDVHALAFTRGEPRSLERDGVRVDLARPTLHLGNAPVDPGFARRVGQVIRRERPDVVVGHTPVPFPAEMASRAANRAGVPFVVTYHAGRLRGSTPVLDGLAALDRATFERRMLATSDRLIAVSPFVRDNALARQRERTTVIPPGVDTAMHRPAAGRKPQSGLPGGNVLFVGPLDTSYRWKGVDTLVDAFHIVRRSLPATTLTLVGRGDRVPEFTARAQHDPGLLVKPKRLSEEELVREYQAASVLVLPSLTDAESFGMVLAEANACGTPVVGSRIGGIPDFVRPGDNGLLAEPGNAHDLADRLQGLLADPATAHAMGRRGRQRVAREHDWDDLARRTEEVLQDASGSLARRPLSAR